MMHMNDQDKYEAAKRDQRIQEEAKELAEKISKFVNNMCDGRQHAKALGSAMLNDHRTLLQTKIVIVIEFLKGLSEDYSQGYYDARNEAACKIADKMLSALTPEDIMYIPFI